MALSKAFAPIANPINCPWGQKAFAGYFGEDDKDSWKKHDATELLKSFKGDFKALVDVVSSWSRSIDSGVGLSSSGLMGLSMTGHGRQLLQAETAAPGEF